MNMPKGTKLGITPTRIRIFEEISHTQLRWELNLTQRLIESVLGVEVDFIFDRRTESIISRNMRRKWRNCRLRRIWAT